MFSIFQAALSGLFSEVMALRDFFLGNSCVAFGCHVEGLLEGSTRVFSSH